MNQPLARLLLRLLLPLAALALVGACNAAEPGANAQPNAAGLADRDLDLAKRLLKDEQGVLVDVRTAGEFGAAHIEGAVNISLQELERSLARIDGLVEGDKDRPIVVYCRSGRRSGIAKGILTRSGHSRVTNFGAMTDWR